MSQRTLVEMNHDYCPPRDDAALLTWARAMRSYLTSGDKRELPRGVVFVNRRHHSERDPCEGRGDPR